MASSIPPRTPVIVGVGQTENRNDDDPVDPITLALAAIEAAATDAGARRVLDEVDTVAVAPVASWRYGDAARPVAERLGRPTAFTMYPQLGGNTPQMLVNRLAERISSGESDLGVLTGSECYRTRMRARRSGHDVGWTRHDLAVRPDWTDSEHYDLGHPAELALGIMMPTQCYPLFENALWHESGRTAAGHQRFIAELWAGLSAVAAANPHAWDRQLHTADEIGTVTDENRMIGFPYTKAMISNPDVNMASAAIICSVERAEALGIPRDHWVFPHSGADATDPLMSNRTSFTTSAAMRHAGAAALELAAVHIDEVEFLDLYSCFPSAVEIACKELGIDPQRTLTVYGGLPFGGGPWSNPVGHALAAMVGALREHPGARGLLTANGGNIQKHSFGVYSTEPPAEGFRSAHPQFAVDTEPPVTVLEHFEGNGVIETWTVMHERDGSPARAHAVVRTPAGERVWAATDDPDTMAVMERVDVCGADVAVLSDATLCMIAAG